MSPRSLNRRLSEEQTIYREILEDMRRELSACYLSQYSSSGIEVAFRLGYADSSKFHPGLQTLVQRFTQQLSDRRRAR